MKQKQIDRRAFLIGGASLAAAAPLCNSAHADDSQPKSILSALQFNSPFVPSFDLAVQNIKGEQKLLSSWQGKPLILHAWATWCAPCKKELPALDGFIAKWGSVCPVLPIALASHDSQKVSEFLNREGLSHIGSWTADWQKLGQWAKVSEVSLPTTFLVDAKGAIRSSFPGDINWGVPDAGEQIHQVLRQL
ncbi:TlpA family protein disulfide reductase [Swingsia samuiensis]|uniref:TlpA family protein disulfide reductase n=1 Tax=Swingsia samuiensis TaxID=1293412 RepID=A0A4Y6ULG7_9PROT|nr:TlpA disulfide reductase family protein [Swingsia samuiensis]QDH17630.1 TlpA family protein disulfide reductase [Swingsia samuiensis]